MKLGKGKGLIAKGVALAMLLIGGSALAQVSTNESKFKQLGQELPTPNVYRTASGAPGHEYYQQKADYDMQLSIDEEKHILRGTESITYTNNSPDQLTYLWVQLDQNVRAQDSDSKKINNMSIDPDRGISFNQMKRLHSDFDGGFKVEYVKDASGKDLPYTINNTMMRIDLPKPLASKGSYTFKIKWWYNINNRAELGGRSGYEWFEDEGNALYTIAQYYPRMCVYNEFEGWQNKQFLGS